MLLDILRLGGGLLLLISAKIAIGSIGAIINKEWDWRTFWGGVIKGASRLYAFVAVYLAGWLNPELMVIEINGKMMNLQSAAYVILLGVYVVYAVDVVKKLMKIGKNKEQRENSEREQE